MYFDYTATTPIDLDVLEVINRVQKDYYGNTESLHRFGKICDNLFSKAKREIREIINVDMNLVFTHNATEANNLGIFGVVNGKKGKIITTKIEHPSVYEVFKHLESLGYKVIYLDVLKDGKIDLKMLEKEMDKDVLLVSVMWVNNIIGTIQPIKEIINIVKKYPKAKLHVDAVQGFCKLKPNFDFNELDLFTISAHKFFGPKGVGCLFYKKSMILGNHIYGSNVQNGIKPGTIDLAGSVGTCKAIKKFYPLIEKNYNYVKELYNYLYNHLSKISFVSINSFINESPYIFNFSVRGINGETIIHMLDEKEIYVSTGSACSSKLKKPEKTILAVTNNEELANSAIRVSLSYLTTKEEVEYLIKVIKEIK